MKKEINGSTFEKSFAEIPEEILKILKESLKDIAEENLKKKQKETVLELLK